VSVCDRFTSGHTRTLVYVSVCLCVCVLWSTCLSVCCRFTSGHTRTLVCLVPLSSCKESTFCCQDVIIVYTTSLLMTHTSASRPAGSIIRLNWLTFGLVLRVSSRLWLALYLALMTWPGQRSLTSCHSQQTTQPSGALSCGHHKSKMWNLAWAEFLSENFLNFYVEMLCCGAF